MVELCFNTFNRSPYLGGAPDLAGAITAAAAAGFRLFGPDLGSIDAWVESGRTVTDLRRLLDEAGMECWEVAPLVLGDDDTGAEQARHIAEIAAVLQPAWVLTTVGSEPDA